ncbi:malate:quinone oxidoreductase [Patescibacteria group bacterium]|nr:malate:quinone oxidoreductase [Patescibacteria group bacterium]
MTHICRQDKNQPNDKCKFTTKFLKNGSFFDLLKSLQWHNIIAMLGA